MNKVETKVDALLDVDHSNVLTAYEKTRLHVRLKNRINADGILVVSCSETRSQKRNREIASARLIELIRIALAKKKIRKKTGIPKGVIKKRLDKKKRHSEKKNRRNFKPDT